MLQAVAQNFAAVVVSIGKNMSLEVYNEDLELVEDDKNELGTEDLEQFQEQQQKAIVKEMFSEEDVGREDAPSCLISKICAKQGDVQSFLELNLPDKVEKPQRKHFSMPSETF